MAFSHDDDDDKRSMMMNGLWFIYNHYLIVKDWRPYFQQEIDTISEVAVWVKSQGFQLNNMTLGPSPLLVIVYGVR